MKSLLKQFVGDDRGQDIVEYVLLTAGIGFVTLLGTQAFGDEMKAVYGSIAAKAEQLVQ